jgi:hypothetical protein
MDEVTKDNLIDWFGTDNGISNTLLEELNNELNTSRMIVFNSFGFDH